MKLLDLIERVVPRARLYPRWAQRLFAVSFAMTLASFFVWVVMAPAASETEERSQVQLDVGLGGEETFDTQAVPASPDDVTPQAAADRTLAALDAPITYELNGRTIAPKVPYLKLVRGGGPLGGLAGLDFVWWYPAEKFPLLDVKIANTGAKIVFLSAASVHVARSVPDPEPIPFVYQGRPSEPRMFAVGNRGWGRMEGTSLSYDIAAGLTTTRFAESYAYRTEPNADGDFDVSEAIAARQLPARGLGTVWGELSYSWHDSGGRLHRQRAKIVTTVFLAREQEPAGAPAPVQGKYDVELRVSGRNYDVTLRSFNRFIKPQTPDRFVIRVRAKRSSIHTGLETRLRYSDGHVQRSQPLTLRIFVPRSAPSAE
jgi:hypothetical protein